MGLAVINRFIGRISRLRFLFLSMIVYCVSIFLVIILVRSNLWSQVEQYLLGFAVYSLIILLASRRLNDIGLPPYLSFLMLVTPLGKIGNLVGGAFYLYLVIKKGRFSLHPREDFNRN